MRYTGTQGPYVLRIKASSVHFRGLPPFPNHTLISNPNRFDRVMYLDYNLVQLLDRVLAINYENRI